MNHSIFRWLRCLTAGAVFALLLLTCSTDEGSVCESFCSDVCQTLSGCELEVGADCTDECVAGLGDMECSDARPVGQLTCGELRDIYVCAEYCATFCASVAACAPFDERLCAAGCASDPVLCNAGSVAARSCDQLRPEARMYEDMGRALQSDSHDVVFGGVELSDFGLCGDAEDCDPPLGCSAETNTCEICVDSAECTKGFASQPSVCTAQGACLEVECVADDDCLGGDSCDTQTNTCIECTRDEHCAAGVSASFFPACSVESNDCVQCTRDEHCAATGLASLRPACDVDTESCVECTRNEHCSSPLGLCRSADFSCVECLTNEDCPDESPRCDGASPFCTFCESDADCLGRSLPACSDLGCAECSSDAHCTDPAFPDCDTLANQCVPAP